MAITGGVEVVLQLKWQLNHTPSHKVGKKLAQVYN